MGYPRNDALAALEKYDYNLERVSFFVLFLGLWMIGLEVGKLGGSESGAFGFGLAK